MTAGRPPVRIVHLGLGAFCRAHVCGYLQDLGGWGVLGVSLRSGGVRDALAPRDFRYTAATLTSEGMDLRQIDVLRGCLVAPEDPAAVLAAMADPAVNVVTMTVTEKGYCHDPATGKLNADHPDIRHDIAAPLPRSAPGFLVRALASRRAAGTAPFTVLSCDNLSENGALTRAVVLDLARRIDPDLADWIASRVAFPSSMVDRIVPATTPSDVARIAAQSGQPDAAPVLHEPFRQWVITDDVSGDLTDLARVGVQIVPDIAPFEDMKLRMLNGAHSALAYLGPLAGFHTVAEAAADPAMIRYLHHLWQQEIIPTLSPPPDTDLTAYADTLLTRFANTGIQHRLSQIAMDGSQKIPQRLLATLAQGRALNHPTDALMLALAAWIAGFDQLTDTSDPMASDLRACLAPAPADTISNVLSLTSIFDPTLADAINKPLTDTYTNLIETGANRALTRVGQGRSD